MKKWLVNVIKTPLEIDGLKKVDQPLKMLPINLVAIILISSLTLSFFVNIEILSSVRGEIKPVEQVKIIRSTSDGVISSFHVKNGTFVESGDLLFSLDKSEEMINLERANRLKSEYSNKLKIIDAIVNLKREGSTSFDKNKYIDFLKRVESEKNSNIESELKWSIYLIENFFDKISSLDYEIKEEEANLLVSKYQVDFYEKTLPIVEDKYNAEKKLYNDGFLPEHSIAQSKLSLENEILNGKKAKNKLVEIENRITYLSRQKESFFNELMLNLNKERIEIEEVLTELETQISLSEVRIKNLDVIAPTTGFIEEVQSFSVGSYITNNEIVMKLTPQSEITTAQISIPNEDIGFVKKGQKVRIKVDAFNYQKYGTLLGEIEYINNDVSISPLGKKEYMAIVNLEKNFLVVENVKEELQFGMALSADIITGKRTLIEYFTHPITSNFQNPMTER